MNLKGRLARLERKLTGQEPIVLHMADGSVVKLPGDCAFAVIDCIRRGERTRETDLVSRSISSTEPDGALLIDMARAILNSP
jgi:hypothetical protein